MSDCIHLHACRALHKRLRDSGGVGARYVARGCTEGCFCYQTARKVLMVDPESAAAQARSDAHLIRGGYDEYDVYCACDFPVEECWVIENGPMCIDDWDREFGEVGK